VTGPPPTPNAMTLGRTPAEGTLTHHRYRMSHKGSRVKALLNDHVLAIGILPEVFTPEELAGVVGEVYGVSKDPDEAEAEIRKRFAERSFGLMPSAPSG
jgi:hypothetical protein